MRHIIILGDGMADWAVPALGGKTLLQAAHTPYMDLLARQGRTGRLTTVPAGFHPGSEVANMSVMGYDLPTVYEGRGVLEAASIGVDLQPGEMAMRCNIVCLEGDLLKNHSAGHITTEEADVLIKYLQQELGDDRIHFYTGVQYRHLLVICGGDKRIECVPPHDVPLKPWRPLLVKPMPGSEDIAVPEGAQYALRRYDGGARATSGTGQSWTDVEEDETVAAGTGFIFQASQDGWYSFHALDDAAKQYVAANKEFAKALAANPSDVAADRGWNLVGNPYQTYYNIHRLNFTAPITLWNAGSRTYEAYSIIDDDVALQPGQAFFVQCPDEVESISFPLEGRQLTADIESQTAANQMGPGHGGSTRLLLDLSLACGELADRTRVVLNNAAEETYETACDAAKFMSDATDVPQLYSLGADGTRYAINERPEGDGTVRLGFRAGSDGSFTLRLTRHEGCHAWLTDLKTGTTADLAEIDYHFTAEAGTDETRFVLAVEPDATTGIGSATTTETLGATATQGGIALTGRGTATVYGADGRKLGTYDVQGQRTVNVPAGIYVVSTPQGSVKVTVNR